MTHERNWRLASLGVTLVLSIVLMVLWGGMIRYEPVREQLTRSEVVSDRLGRVGCADDVESVVVGGKPQAACLAVPTGLFIQSLKFLGPSEVHLSGYIWQHYLDEVHDQIKPAVGEYGFVFPEQVNSGSDISPREVYRRQQGDATLIGWYFEAAVRQKFNYRDYPFDHKTVWLRLWSNHFSKNVILTPDLAAYVSTDVDAVFGIEQDIVLGNWQRQDTYYDYKFASYDTNFGILDYVGQRDFPELHFNIELVRNFGNAFIVYLLPLFVVSLLLFSILLTVSENSHRVALLGFSASNFIAGCSALFFIVLLAHIQLREQFASSGIVYLEKFYILMYCYLGLATANAYCFSTGSSRLCRLLRFRDNILPKLFYWPVLILAMVLITLPHTSECMQAAG